MNNKQVNHNCSEAERYSALANGGCGLCQRKGFPLFLVRKAIIPNYFAKNKSINGVLPLPEREMNDPLKAHQYVYRTLRMGYVYILLQAIGETSPSEYMVYEITPKGAFRHRSIYEVNGEQVNEIPDSCTEKNHYIPAVFINIDTAVYNKAWIAYSPIPWGKIAQDHYKKEGADLSRFTAVDLTQTAAKKLTDARSFGFNDLYSGSAYLLEFNENEDSVKSYDAMYDQEKNSILTAVNPPQKGEEDSKNNDNIDSYVDALIGKKSREQHLFATAAKFNTFLPSLSLDADTKAKIEKPSINLKEQVNLHAKNLITPLDVDDLGVIVLEDTLGIAEELSVQRRMNINELFNQLRDKEEELALELMSHYTKLKGGQSFVLRNTLLNKNKKERINNSEDEENRILNQDIDNIKQNESLLDQTNEQSLNSLTYGESTPVTFPLLTYHFNKMSRNKALLEYNKKRIEQHGPADYFSDAMSLKRRIAACIESYKSMLKKAIIEKNKNRPIDVRIKYYRANGSLIYAIPGNDTTYTPHHGNVSNNKNANDQIEFKIYLETLDGGNAVEVPLTQIEEEAYLQRYSKDDAMKGVDQSDATIGAPDKPSFIKKFIYPNSTLDRNKIEFNTQWANYEKKLDLNLYNQFLAEMKLSKKALEKKVNDFSDDYIHYIMWLFGNNKANYYKPPKLSVKNDKKIEQPQKLFNNTDHNTVKFWEIECSANYTTAHLDMLQSINVILDGTDMAKFNSDKHDAFWHSLNENENSILAHLFGQNDKNSFFNYTVDIVNTDEGSLIEPIQWVDKIKTVLLSDNVKQSLISDHWVHAHQQMQEIMSKNIKFRPANLSSGNNSGFKASLKYESNMLDYSRFLSGKDHITVKTVQTRIRDLPEILNDLSKKNSFFGEMAESISLESNKSTINLQTAENGWNFSGEMLNHPVDMDKIIEFKIVTVTEKPNHTPKSHINKFDLKKEQGNVVAIGSSNDKNDTLKMQQMQNKIDSDMVHVDSTITINMNMFIIGLNTATLFENYQKLDDQSLDQGVRDKIDDAIIKTYRDITLTAAETLLHFAQLGYIKQWSVCNKFTGKGLLMVGKYVGVISSVVGVYDSLFDLISAYKSLSLGNSGSVGYMVGSFFMFTSSVIGLVTSFCFIPGLGWLALALGVLGMIVMAIFENKTDDWGLLDEWFNNCYFGKHDHPDQFEFYSLTYAHTALAMRDFLLASQGALIIMQKQRRETDLFNQTKITGNYLYNKLSNVDSQRYTIDYLPNAFQKGKISSIYLNIQLPNYTKQVSDFEGTLSITTTETKQQQLVFQLTPDNTSSSAKHMSVSLQDPVTTSPLIGDAVIQVYDPATNKAAPLPSEEVWYGINAKPQNSAEKTENLANKPDDKFGPMQINQKIMEVYGDFSLIIILNYWPEGRFSFDKNGVKQKDKPLEPYLLDYQYPKGLTHA